jgi:hypothetical protein
VNANSQFNGTHVEARNPFDKNRLRVSSVLVSKCLVLSWSAAFNGVPMGIIAIESEAQLRPYTGWQSVCLLTRSESCLYCVRNHYPGKRPTH